MGSGPGNRTKSDKSGAIHPIKQVENSFREASPLEMGLSSQEQDNVAIGIVTSMIEEAVQGPPEVA